MARRRRRLPPYRGLAGVLTPTRAGAPYTFKGQHYGPQGTPFRPGVSPGFYPGAPRRTPITPSTYPRNVGGGPPPAGSPGAAAGGLPPGTYDPDLDAKFRAAQRNLGYSEEDYLRIGARESDDLQTALAKIAQARGIATEDRNLATGDLTRRFQNLAVQQESAARAAGVARGGTLAASLAKRSENQRLGQEDIDRTLARQMQGFSDQQSGLVQAFQRAATDRTTDLARQRTELGFFGTDTEAIKAAQAKASGYEFPAPKPPPLTQNEYLRRLRALRDRHGAGSAQVEAFRRRWYGNVR